MLVGPFTGEFGDEIITWIPFLRSKGLNCLAISRGDTGSWYPGPVLNAYDVVSPAEFKTFLAARKAVGSTKARDGLDDLILERFGLPKPAYHPSPLFLDRGADRCAYHQYCERFAPVERYPGLPARYIAVRLYENQWLYEAPEIVADLPLVGLFIDDQPDNHAQLDYPCDIRVHYKAHDSFRVLSRVISHAEKVICNYGSVPFLGISYGKKVEAWSHYPIEHSWHFRTEQRVATKLGGSIEVKFFDAKRKKRTNRLSIAMGR